MTIVRSWFGRWLGRSWLMDEGRGAGARAGTEGRPAAGSGERGRKNVFDSKKAGHPVLPPNRLSYASYLQLAPFCGIFRD